ncbi:MAG: acetate kinase, partial [Rhizobacter sp.]
MNPNRLKQTARHALCAAACASGMASAFAQAGASTPNAEPTPRPAAPEPVGKAPEAKPLEVAPIFEGPGVLTPKGAFVFEPSFQYAYSTSNRVALIGYTIIPAIVIGVIDVREVKRTSLTTTLTGRYGLSNRAEIEFRLPYVLRSDDSVGRELQTSSPESTNFNAKGHDIGDIEAIFRYQLNDGGLDKPFFVGSLRFKSRTGKDPFEVITDCVNRCLGNTTGTGLPLDAPTGSGFYSLQPSLTWLFPSDPAVFFGTVSYTYQFARDDVTRLVLNGQEEFIGKIKPGDVFGINFGMGLALN